MSGLRSLTVAALSGAARVSTWFCANDAAATSAGAREVSAHSPITFRITRLGRWPSNSA